MSQSVEQHLRTALRAATERVVAPADLAERVTAAAPRPAPPHRSRMALLLAPVAVVAVVAAVVLVLPRVGDGDPAPATLVGEALLDRPTGGELAGDTALVAEAARTFDADARPVAYAGPALPAAPTGARAAGEARVLWAGTTGTGPAAVVVQREEAAQGPAIVVGYLGTVGGRLTLAAVSRRVEGYAELAGAFVGTGGRTLLVLEQDAPLTWSYRHDYVPGGGIRLRDRPLEFSGGVAAVDLPAGVSPGLVRVTRAGAPGLGRGLLLGRPAGVPEEPASGPRLPSRRQGGEPDSVLFPVGSGDALWPDPPAADGGRYFQLLRTMREAVDALPTDLSLYGSAGDDAWYAFGATPDGRRLVATDMAAAGDPSRAYVVLVRDGRPGTVVDGGPVDRLSPVPFRVRLPDGQGWLVAAPGVALSYRVGDGAWTAAGTDAALLPAGATAVRAGGGAAVPLR